MMKKATIRNLQSKNWAIFVLFFLIALGIYGNALTNDFVLDDEALIVNNAYIKNIAFLPRLFTTSVFHFGINARSNHYRPLQMLSYAFDYSIWKLNPFGYRLSNIIIHAINCLLIYIVLMQLFRNARLALIAVTLFCVHPLHSSAIGYIAGRADLLVALFILISIIKFLRYIKAHKLVDYIMSIVFFACALLSRENAILMPLLLIPVCVSMQAKSRNAYFSILGFLVLDAFYIIARLWVAALYKIPLQNNISIPTSLHVINLINVIKEYATLLIIPWPLYPMRTIPFISQLTVSHVVFIVCLISLIGLIVVRSVLKKEHVLTFGLWWSLVGFAPVTYLIYRFVRRSVTMAEHWLYLPSIGIFVLLAYVLCSLKKMRMVVLVVLVCFLSTLTIANNRVWRNKETLYQHALQHSPHNTTFRQVLAHHYWEQKSYAYDKAINEIKTILRYEPMTWDVMLLIGNIYFAKNDMTHAMQSYKKTLKLNPRCYQAYNNIGMLYEKQNDPERAREAFVKAIEINPHYWLPYTQLGRLFGIQQLYAEAIICLKKAQQLKPDDGEITQLLNKAITLSNR